MGAPDQHGLCPFFLKLSSQGNGDHPDPLNDQDDATMKAIIVGHLQMPLATNLFLNHGPSALVPDS